MKPAAGDALLDVTVWLRARGRELEPDLANELGATLPARRRYAKRGELARASDADPADLAALRAYLREHGIEAVETRWRALHARGTVAALSKAFGTKLDEWGEKRLRFRQRIGPLRVPPSLAPILSGVFGLDAWPNVHPVKAPPEARSGTEPAREAPPALTARAVANAYEFPAGDGRGQTIGILSFGARFSLDDLQASLSPQGIAAPAVVIRRVDPGTARSENESFDQELALDTHVAAALAPGAKLVLYDAPHDERGFLDAVAAALFDEEHAPAVLSISYGRPECCWTPNALDVMDELFIAAARLGVSVFCASGDHGAVEVDGEPRVFAPASSPFVHACGGTRVEHDAHGRRVERSWQQSGGGFSERAGPPHWQAVAADFAGRLHARHGRGVPDVAAHAFPPAFPISVGGRPSRGGGTSAVAPLWAALTARLNERLGTPLGFYAPLFYAAPKEAGLFRIAAGEGNGKYPAPEGQAWNPCTGLGVPRGTALERALCAASD
ncbi:MAG: protease pro-enzyme activation domain-containing protein [Vulcanimicrobiaceae bacterium]